MPKITSGYGILTNVSGALEVDSTIQFLYASSSYLNIFDSGSLGSIKSLLTSATETGAYGSIIITTPDNSNLASTGSEVIRFSSSGSLPRIGIGTKKPISIFEVKSPTNSSKTNPDIVLSVPSGSITVGDESSRLSFVIEDEQFSGSQLFITGGTAAIYSRVLGQNGFYQYGSLAFEVDGGTTYTQDRKALELGYNIGRALGGNTDINAVFSGSIEIGGITYPNFTIFGKDGFKRAQLGQDNTSPFYTDGGEFYLYNLGDDVIAFRSINENSFISSSGTWGFGLGTKNPNEKLEVVGNIAITSGSVSSSLQTVNTTLASDSATNVDTFATVSYTGAIYDYILIDATVGARAGHFMVAHDNGNITFTDTSTRHLTDPLAPEISAQINGANIEVQVTNGNGYTFKSFVKKL